MTQNTVNEAMAQQGRADALELQEASPSMTGTELNAAAQAIPMFYEACRVMNMLQRPIGFVCCSSSGRIVKLLQPYDSSVYLQEPEMLPAQWGFVWSDDPAHARPFIALSTSPYQRGNVCSWGLEIYRSKIDGNVWSPADYPPGWEYVASIQI